MTQQEKLAKECNGKVKKQRSKDVKKLENIFVLYSVLETWLKKHVMIKNIKNVIFRTFLFS